MINNSDKQVGLCSGGFIFGEGLIFGMRWALVHVVGLYTGGFYSGGLYSEVYGVAFMGIYTWNKQDMPDLKCICISSVVHIWWKKTKNSNVFLPFHLKPCADINHGPPFHRKWCLPYNKCDLMHPIFHYFTLSNWHQWLKFTQSV